MNGWLKRGLQMAVFSAGMFTLGVGIASAADTGNSGPIGEHHGLLSVPISVSNNSVAVLGGAHAAAPGGPADAAGTDSGGSLIAVPIVVSDNAIAVGGHSTASSSGSASPAPSSKHHAVVSVPVTVSDNAVSVSGKSASSAPSPGSSSGSSSPASHQHAVVSVPVTVSGNAISVLGTSTASAPAAAEGSATDGSHGSSGSGPAANPPRNEAVASVPVTVCGNAVGLLGSAGAACTPASAGSANRDTTVLDAPVLACGNAIGNAVAACGDPTASGSSTPTSGSTGSEPGGTVVNAPVTVCGIAGGALGSATAACGSDTRGTPSNPGSPSNPAPAAGGGGVPGHAATVVPIAHLHHPGTVGPDVSVIIGPADAGGVVSPLAYTGIKLQAMAALAALLFLIGAALTVGARRSAGRTG